MRLLHVQHIKIFKVEFFEGEERSKPTINAIVDCGKAENLCEWASKQVNKMAKLMRARTVHTSTPPSQSTVLHMHGFLICWF